MSRDGLSSDWRTDHARDERRVVWWAGFAWGAGVCGVAITVVQVLLAVAS